MVWFKETWLQEILEEVASVFVEKPRQCLHRGRMLSSACYERTTIKCKESQKCQPINDFSYHQLIICLKFNHFWVKFIKGYLYLISFQGICPRKKAFLIFSNQLFDKTFMRYEIYNGLFIRVISFQT